MTGWLLTALVAGCAFVAATPLQTRLSRGDHLRPTDSRGHRSHRWVFVILPLAAAVTAFVVGDRHGAVIGALYAAMCVPLIALVAIDAEVHRLPDRITYPLIPVALGVATISSALTGDWSGLPRAAMAGLVAFVAYAVLMLASPGGAGLGFGDVKLAASLGVLTGWFSWEAVLGATMLAFLLGGGWAAMLLLTRRATRHTHVAFGPFLIGGAMLAWLGA